MTVMLSYCSTQKSVVKKDDTYVVTAKKGINLRETPDKEGEVLTVIPSGAEIIILIIARQDSFVLRHICRFNS